MAKPRPRNRSEPTINIICIDADRVTKEQIERIFTEKPMRMTHEKTMTRVLEHFERERFDLLIISSSAAKGGELDGIEMLEVIAINSPATQVLLLINPKDVALAMSALRLGTYHYAKLPIGDEELRLLIETALERRPTYGPNLLLKEETNKNRFEDIVGGSPVMHQAYRYIRQAAMTDIPVLLTGETGTGKDLAARAIHQLSERSEAPYVPIHLGALPQDLVAGELFGYEKGAFTGATTRHGGCFEQAHGGTVFLDEISTINERVQISLLRLLETKSFQRIGGHETITANVRIVAAGNEDLAGSVREGKFREDLYYRLEVFQIHMPPVRNRAGDITLLVNHFLNQYNEAYQKNILGISPECVALLEQYAWPGNVREVKNVIHRAVVMCTGEVLLADYLPARIRSKRPGPPEVIIPVGSSLEEAERQMIIQTLKYAENNRQRTASILGISRRSLYNKLKKYNLERIKHKKTVN
jgi:DNA-binding NtrC family response regulator